MVFCLFFSYRAFTSGGKAKWKINQQHANFYFKFLRIVNQIAFIFQAGAVDWEGGGRGG